jgi:hypothetical protein
MTYSSGATGMSSNVQVTTIFGNLASYLYLFNSEGIIDNMQL